MNKRKVVILRGGSCAGVGEQEVVYELAEEAEGRPVLEVAVLVLLINSSVLIENLNGDHGCRRLCFVHFFTYPLCSAIHCPNRCTQNVNSDHSGWLPIQDHGGTMCST